MSPHFWCTIHPSARPRMNDSSSRPSTSPMIRTCDLNGDCNGAEPSVSAGITEMSPEYRPAQEWGKIRQITAFHGSEDTFRRGPTAPSGLWITGYLPQFRCRQSGFGHDVDVLADGGAGGPPPCRVTAFAGLNRLE